MAFFLFSHFIVLIFFHFSTNDVKFHQILALLISHNANFVYICSALACERQKRQPGREVRRVEKINHLV